ncbi:hypothetical protein RND81_03G187200 [Saponaria officinalis]|uniref:Uncharacterized protein n=1 Tax=Saponaria officinalis TaxID=3572 RepID=A0AAW1MAK9_SAPOF
MDPNWRASFTNMLNNTNPEIQENYENRPNLPQHSFQPFFGYQNMPPPNFPNPPNFSTPPMPIYNYACFYPRPSPPMPIYNSGYGVTDNYSPGPSATKTKVTVNLGENISSSEQEPDSPVPPYSTQEGLDNITVNVEGSKREKWTTIEDKALIEAWVTISTDASVGNDQKGGAFWQRVTNYFNRYSKGKNKRTLDPESSLP